MQPLNDDDLALAHACLAGDPAAQRALDRMIREEATRAVGALRQPAWLIDEVHQEVAQKLLVGPSPRLAGYAGQSSLGRWLGVTATRTALNLVTRQKRNVPLDDGASDDDLLAAITDPELAILRERYREDVLASLRAAFDALAEPRDRNLLRLYYVDRVGVEQLGEMFGVHASTVSRWLAALRSQLADDTQERLAERLGIEGHPQDVASVIQMLRSQLDLTLSRVLR